MRPWPALVGRPAELAVLDALLLSVAQGRGTAVAVVGEAGIGKSRLLAELGDRADARGMLVLSGAASEFEQDLPFWPFVDALDDDVRSLPPARLTTLDDDAALGTPSRAAVVAGRGPGHVWQPGQRPAVPHPPVGVQAAGGQPAGRLVLLLDDLHWADSGSVGAAARAAAPPTRWSGAARHRAAPAAGGRPARGRATPRRGQRPARPRRAGRAETRRHAAAARPRRRREPRPDAARRERRQPVLPAAARPGPARPGRRHGRATRTSSSDRRRFAPRAPSWPASTTSPGAGAGAAGGAADPFLLEIAAAAAALPDTAMADALDELQQRDLVRPTDAPRRFRFRHPLARRAVYWSAPAGWRLGADERCAQALADRGVPVAGTGPPRHPGGPRRATGRPPGCSGTPDKAVVGRAPGEAARWFSAALDLLPGTATDDALGLWTALGRSPRRRRPVRRRPRGPAPRDQPAPGESSATRARLIAECAGLEQTLGDHDDAYRRRSPRWPCCPTSTAPRPSRWWGRSPRTGSIARSTLRRGSGRSGARRRRAAVADGRVGRRSGSQRRSAAPPPRPPTACPRPDPRRRDVRRGDRGSADPMIARLAGAELLVDRPADAARHAERALAASRASAPAITCRCCSGPASCAPRSAASRRPRRCSTRRSRSHGRRATPPCSAGCCSPG